MTKGKISSAPKEKQKLPDEWKELFLGIKSTETVEEFVKCLVQKILELDDNKKESFYAHYKKSEFKERVEKIFTAEEYEQIDYKLSVNIMRPFYKKYGVRNLNAFLEKLQSLPTPPQSQESKS